MPMYEFRCDRCGNRFETRMTIVEHGQNRPECPKCHTDEWVHGSPARFAAMTDKKS
jgi:putative FmdB family regulatory protein